MKTRFCVKNHIGRESQGTVIIPQTPTTTTTDKKISNALGFWLSREFQWSEASAQRYMAVAGKFSNSTALSYLPITQEALYLLAGPTVPAEAREEAVERAGRKKPGRDCRPGKAGEFVVRLMWGPRAAVQYRAGVEPRVERLNGQDPEKYIVSMNAKRRDLTKPQSALAARRCTGARRGGGQILKPGKPRAGHPRAKCREDEIIRDRR